MYSAAPNIFLESDGRAEERGAATNVKRFGGAKPRDLDGVRPGSRLSSPSRAQSPETMSQGGIVSQRLTPSAQSFVLPGASTSHSGFTHKDRRLLALNYPIDEETSFRSRQTETPTVNEGVSHNNGFSHKAKTECSDQQESLSISQLSVGAQPLEERFCLEDLRQLMYFFSVDSNLLDDFNAKQALENDETMRKDPSSKPCNEQSSSPVGNVGGMGLTRSQKHLHSSGAQRRSCDSQPSNTVARTSNNSNGGFRCAVDIKVDSQRALLMCELNKQSTGCEVFTRVLTEREFAFAVKSVIPDATDADIMELMKKVDYEAKGCTTWDDFATFLVSQSRHRSQLTEGPITDLIATPEPDICPESAPSQHITGTCMEIDLRRKLLLTGGSEGSVRAWKLETLESCGVVFAGDCWVISIHCSSQLQCFFIVTMDRKLIVLDSKTLEVRRLYRGRAVVESIDGYLYAHDSVQQVEVGGKSSQRGGQFAKRRGGSDVDATANQSGRGSTTFSREQSRRGKGNKKPYSAPIPFSASITGSYAQCRVEECILAGLVDSVSCSLFHHSALQEDMLLFATVTGEVRFYDIPKIPRRVLFPHAVVHLHLKRINKMSILFDFNALLTASDDGTVKMTSLDTGALLRTFSVVGNEQHSAVHSFAVNTQQRLLVTVGPERYGIVWDLSHDLRGVVLDSHNSPCRGCAMNLKHGQIFTSGTDGSIFVFSIQGFRLMQVIHVHSLSPQCILYDEERMRLLCLAGYPYYHGRRRHTAIACSSKYKGHMASMIGVMYNRTYDLIITIDIEGLVMTWKRCSGTQVLAFQLRDFSDSAVMNAARLTCYALDGLERRLLTGFQNGAVAVWNVVNGQTTNVITAAAECFATTTIKPEVMALGSLIRDGITFFFFAAAGQLFSTRESSTFTIASATKWEVAEHYGEILFLLPTSPQIIACGTSSGALIFYHILAEQQVGSALWVVDISEAARRSTTFPSDKMRNDQPGSALTSRIIAMFPLKAVGAHILMVVHADGTVALWHTLRRMLMETVNVRHAFPTGRGEANFLHVAVDGANQHFVFADERGNIHVCTIQLRAVHDKDSMRLPRKMRLQDGSHKQTVYWPGSPFSNQETTAGHMQTDSNTQQDDVGDSDTNQQKQEEEVEMDNEKTLYVFFRFYQDYVFHCGFPSVSGLSVISAPSQQSSTTAVAAPTHQLAEDENLKENVNKSETRSDFTTDTPGEDFSNTMKMDVSLPPFVSDVMIVVSSGSDNFTRVFALDGTIIGDCGMNGWTLGKTSTYEFLGVKQTRRLSAMYCGAETMDFLRETFSGEGYSFSNTGHARSTRSRLMSSKSFGDVHLANTQQSHCMGTSVGDLSSMSGVGQTGGGVSLEITQTECPSIRSQSLEPQRFVSKEQQQQQQQQQDTQKEEERLGTRSTAIARSPFSDEVVTLSTHIRSRRSREECLQGLVKKEFVSKLRGLPLVDIENDSSNSKLMLGVPNTPRGLARVELSTTSSPVVSNQNQANNYSLASTGRTVLTGNALSEGTTVSLETANQFSPVLVVGGGALQAGRQLKLKTRTVPRKWTLAMSGERDPMHHYLPSTGQLSVGFNGDTSPLEVESYRAELLQGHMETKRRMLRSVGGNTALALESMFPRGTSVLSSVTPFESSKGTFCSQLLAKRRIKGDSVTEARSCVAQITSRLQVFHVEPISPPKGTQTHDGASALKKKT